MKLTNSVNKFLCHKENNALKKPGKMNWKIGRKSATKIGNKSSNPKDNRAHY